MLEAFIRQVALEEGIDPDIAVRVARAEGGLTNPYQRGMGPAPRSQASGFGATENSFGPFQLYISGNNAGLGDRAVAAGIDPRKDWQGGVRYALKEAAQKGWGQWYGAAKAGVGNYDGIGGKRVAGALPNPNERLGGDGLVPRNTYSQVAAATNQMPHDASTVASIGNGQPGPAGSIDPNALQDKKDGPLKGILSALAQMGDGPSHARMGPMGDARQSGGGLLELLGAGGNPYAQLARKQRGILG